MSKIAFSRACDLIKANDIFLLDWFIKKYPGLIKLTYNGLSLLSFAVASGSKGVVETLLKAGANPFFRASCHSLSPWELSISAARIDAAKLIFSEFQNSYCFEELSLVNWQYAIGFLCEQRNDYPKLEMLKWLNHEVLTSVSLMTLAGKRGFTGLIKNKDEDVIRYLISTAPVKHSTHEPFKGAHELAYIACQEGQPQIAMTFISHGVFNPGLFKGYLGMAIAQHIIQNYKQQGCKLANVLFSPYLSALVGRAQHDKIDLILKNLYALPSIEEEEFEEEESVEEASAPAEIPRCRSAGLEATCLMIAPEEFERSVKSLELMGARCDGHAEGDDLAQ